MISRCLKWHPDLPCHVALVLGFSDSVCFRNCFFPQDNVALLRTDRFLSCLLTCRTVFTAELTFSKSCRWAKYENLSFIGQSFIHWKNLLLTISPLQTLSCMLGKYFLWLLWLLSWDQQLYRKIYLSSDKGYQSKINKVVESSFDRIREGKGAFSMEA